MIKKIVKKIIPDDIRLYRHKVDYFLRYLWNVLFAEKTIKSFKDVPIVINNYNRLTCLKELVEGLEERGYTNIHIIDNNSTYPPLLDYYKKCQHTLYLLDKNMGFLAFSKSGIYKKFRNKFFVYTDSDIYLPKDCPDDIIERYYSVMCKYPHVAKVGSALRIDDIPDCYALKKKVIDWESRFWEKPLGDDCYEAVIDTTIALYKPNFKVGPGYAGMRIRVAGKYTVIHRPWYIDSNNINEEEQYYINSVQQSTFWSKLCKAK